jgi:hypothetical protein
MGEQAIEAGDERAVNKPGSQVTLDDPFDLRPAVAMAMQHVAARMATRKPGQPIVLVVGERHSKPSHILFEEALVRALARAYPGKVAAGFEFPHNMCRVTPLEIEDPAERAAARLTQIRRFQGAVSEWTSGSTRERLVSVFRARAIPMALNDIAKKQGLFGNVIDLNDPASRDMAHAFFPGRTLKKKNWFHWPKPIYRHTQVRGEEDTNGITLSNAFMAARAAEHMEEAGAEIYVQICGRLHLLGNALSGYSFEDSLGARFLQGGYDVIPVFLDNADTVLGDLPTEGADFLRDKGVNIRGLSLLSRPYEDEACEHVLNASGDLFAP